MDTGDRVVKFLGGKPIPFHAVSEHGECTVVQTCGLSWLVVLAISLNFLQLQCRTL